MIPSVVILSLFFIHSKQPISLPPLDFQVASTDMFSKYKDKRPNVFYNFFQII